MPSVRRKYSVTVCPILPENVTRNVDDVVTVEHGPLTLNETQTLVAYVPSGFFTVPVKLIACGVAVVVGFGVGVGVRVAGGDRKSTRLNSSHLVISYAVFCL